MYLREVNDELGLRSSRRSLRNSRLTRLWTGVAAVGFCTGGGAWAIGALVRTEAGRHHVVIAVAAFGGILLLFQLGAYRLTATAEQVLRFYRSPHFWGV